MTRKPSLSQKLFAPGKHALGKWHPDKRHTRKCEHVVSVYVEKRRVFRTQFARNSFRIAVRFCLSGAAVPECCVMLRVRKLNCAFLVHRIQMSRRL